LIRTGLLLSSFIMLSLIVIYFP